MRSRMQGAHVRVCRVHSWHKMMPSMLASPLVRSKLALGDHIPPEPNLKMPFFLPCFVCVHVGGCHAHTGRRRVWVSLYLCRIHVGVHIAVAHCGEMPESSEKWSQNRFLAFSFRFIGSWMAHPRSIRGVCAGVVVETWVLSLF